MAYVFTQESSDEMNNALFFRMPALALVLVLATSQFAYAHPGGLDKNGGHVDKATGRYHCHRAPCSADSQHTTERRPAPATVTFQRSEWGSWKDADNDCQDTRTEVLQRDSSSPVTFADNRSCTITKGVWHDPYTGDQFELSVSLDIDHIVPLEWANNHGGASWTTARKQGFTNELENLIAVGAGINRDKGSQGPDKWLPPDENYRCLYLAKFLHVYRKYALQFSAAEKQAVTAIAVSCDLTI
jgi:hypothetical protein